MPLIEFKAKVREVQNMDGSLAYRYVSIPKLGRQHCDMESFRRSKKFGGFTNSNLFPNMLRRVRDELSKDGTLHLDELPEGVSVDTSKFLAVVTILVKD